MNAAYEIARLVLIVALLCAGSVLATPKGRVPLALRGVLKVLHRDGTVPAASRDADAGTVPLAKRLLALLLVLVAIVLALA